MEHLHSDLDVQPGTVTLCVVDGDMWHHLPVDRLLWDGAGDDQREQFRSIARRKCRTAGLPVEVVRSSGQDQLTGP
ncbi:hypothetical protein OG978_32715 [Streptomyces sp. NBC_01591]|uniref:hypothetical protein n=1 Tax=Streptomyces sp. NBC_01591 TaxID=2975888 RepID=UPI002DDB1372|nr:hypothetical protein [Streptomyces sp. NBC_01591]WSD71737.1 hypothetical protein OG978_32715 [Streptomyces sp. NBC_01591]